MQLRRGKHVMPSECMNSNSRLAVSGGSRVYGGHCFGGAGSGSQPLGLSLRHVYGGHLGAPGWSYWQWKLGSSLRLVYGGRLHLQGRLPADQKVGVVRRTVAADLMQASAYEEPEWSQIERGHGAKEGRSARQMKKRPYLEAVPLRATGGRTIPAMPGLTTSHPEQSGIDKTRRWLHSEEGSPGQRIGFPPSILRAPGVF